MCFFLSFLKTKLTIILAEPVFNTDFEKIFNTVVLHRMKTNNLTEYICFHHHFSYLY